jgi:hypothetical protein
MRRWAYVGMFLKWAVIIKIAVTLVSTVCTFLGEAASTYFGRAPEPELAPQSGLPKGGVKTAARVHKAPVLRTRVYVPQDDDDNFCLLPQADDDLNVPNNDHEPKSYPEEKPSNEQLDPVLNLIRRNIVNVSFQGRKLFALGVAGDVMLTTRHSIDHMTSGSELLLGVDGVGPRLRLNWADVKVAYQDPIDQDKKSDLVFIKLNNMIQFRNITAHFADQALLDTSVERIRPLVNEEKGKQILTYYAETTDIVKDVGPGYDWISSGVYIYGMPGFSGACGLPYVQFQRSGRKIAYIHGFGSVEGDLSGGHPITSLQVKEALQAFKDDSHVPQDPQFAPLNLVMQDRFDGSSADFPVLCPSMVHVSGTWPEGTFPPGIAIHMPSKSRIVTTPLNPMHPNFPLHDADGAISLGCESTRVPADLTAGPQFALNKFAVIKGELNVSPSIPAELTANLPVHHLLPPALNHADLRMCSFEEAILGVDGLAAIDLTKSSGYGYSNHGINRVRALFSAPGQICQKFKGKVTDKISVLHTQVSPSVSMLQTKDELIPKEDYAKGKVRTIHKGELVYTIIGRMLFGLALLALSTAPFQTFVAIGINPHSSHWTFLYNRLKGKNRLSLCGDFSGHEFTLPLIFIALYIRWWNLVMPLNNFWTNVRAHYLWSVLQPYCAVGRRVFRLTKGQGSGNEVTQHFASFCTHTVHQMFWRSLGRTDDEFDELVEGTTLGDDCVYTASNAPDFNMITLAMFCRTIGMHYTTWSKGSIDQPLMDLDEIEFLKRSFKPLGRVTLAPLRLSSIMESLMWEDHRATSEDRANTARSAIIEARHHPRATFELVRTTVNRYLAQIGQPVILDDYATTWWKLIQDHN